MGFWTGKRVVVGIGGGIAAYKVLDLIRRLREGGAVVKVVVTRAALEFVTKVTLQALSGERVHDDLFALDQEWEMGHIRLAREADLVLVAPATANRLAKMAQGLADDLLSALLLARRGPVVVAPAMNSAMWTHPATQRNLAILRNDGIHVAGPATGVLACGEEGPGRLLDVAGLLEEMVRALTPRFLAGRRILVTAGPTREELDPVRYLSNHSSGKMGWAVANAALRAGARVVLIHGPVTLEPPRGADTVPVISAREMHRAALEAWPACHGAILSAAVADYRPEARQDSKIKKEGVGQVRSRLDLTLNPDILADLASRRRPEQVVVGFAAETGPGAVALGRSKLVRKGCDLLAVNDVLESGSGFGTDTNRVTLLSREGGEESWPLLDKAEVGARLVAALGARMGAGEGGL
ncbi:MAG: bifunctional phosphopantothenoylcysteine decarboxylase/phosphopantothenate--cysteine ligase CoaBC [Magnetococcales bacterium]|nr:bifunctional phosphopantothenoylcysteine decarboxylase/phosphopantothenate--cysteine ligase CoaBC [Magnetococcales bacterium]